MILRIIRKVLSSRRRPVRKGKSIFTYAILAMVVLLVVNRLPPSLTRSNPVLSIILFVLVFFGLMWLARFLEEQMNQLPFHSIFRRWEDFCTQNPKSKLAASTPYIGIIIYCPLLVIPFWLGQNGRELMIPVACMFYAVFGYCLEAMTKWYLLRKWGRPVSGG